MNTPSEATVTETASLHQLFSYPFRIFFLSMAILAVLSVPLWVMQLKGMIDLPLALPGFFWHQHEMLFGFLSAAIAGFLLTAVCVWTGTERTHGVALLALWGGWLAGRLLVTLGGALPGWLVDGINLAFMPLVMLDAGRRIWGARQTRQIPVMVVLAVYWLMQVGFVLQLDMTFAYGALVMAMGLISIIGGRITPAFSNGWQRLNAPERTPVQSPPGLDIMALVSLFLLLVSMLMQWSALSGVLAMAAGGLTLVRLGFWKGWRFRSEPLLWILHLSILWIPVSLFLLAGSKLAGWPTSAWSHAAGTGAIGCLVLGVIARVALGHTGRPLSLPKGMVTAFAAIHLSAVLRVLTAFGLVGWSLGIALSSLLWCLAFGIFLVRYGLILASPRVDSRIG